MKRLEKRKKADGSFFYSHNTSSKKMPSLVGLMCNVSKSGACVYTQEYLETGFQIKLYSPAIGLPREATVRWCNQLDAGMFKMGLAFA